MLTLLPILSLLVAAAIITLLGVLRPAFVYHWLIAVLGAMTAWIGIWVVRAQVPLYYGTPENRFQGLPLPTFSLQVDQETWPLALAVATLGLAVLLTDVGRAADISWVTWAGDLGLTAMGVAAALAGNFVTMLLVWGMVDAVELGILLRQVRREDRRRRILVFFFNNLLGSMAVVAAFVAAGGTIAIIPLDQIPEGVEVFLILGVGLRLGVFPLQVSIFSDQDYQRGQGTLLRLIPPAASLSLLVHVSDSQTPVGWRNLLLLFAVLAAIYGAVAWARSENELRGRQFWIIALAGMSISAAVKSQQGAALAWGLAMLYSGAFLFLASVRTRRMLPIGLIAVLALTSLPFTPTFAGLRMYQQPQFLSFILPLAQILIVAGFIRHMRQETAPLEGGEPWVRVVYGLGLAILPLTQYLSVFLGPQIAEESATPIWPLLVGVAYLLVGGLAYWRNIQISDQVFLQMDRVFSLRWIDRVIDWVGKALEQLARGITLLLEGDGGVLWALVFLAMLVSILSQVSAGGG